MRVGVETVVLTGSSNTSHRIGTAPDKNKNIVALSRITIARLATRPRPRTVAGLVHSMVVARSLYSRR